MTEKKGKKEGTEGRKKRDKMGRQKKSKPLEGFELQTGDIAAICNIMYGLKDLVKTVKFNITKEGIRMGERACQDNLFLFADFKAERFDKFECTSPCTICFLPEHMHMILASHQQRDVMIWRFDRSDDRWLYVRRLSEGKEEVEQNYQIPLLLTDMPSYEAPSRPVDYLLGFPPSTINSILTCFKELEKEFADNWVTIRCSEDKVELFMENGFIVNRARFCFLTSKSDPDKVSETERRPLPDEERIERRDVDIHADKVVVENQYRLRYMYQMLKCFSVTRGAILMYISRDYPVIFEMKIGAVGEIKAALMFRDKEAEEEEVNKAQAQMEALKQRQEEQEQQKQNGDKDEETQVAGKEDETAEKLSDLQIEPEVKKENLEIQTSV